MRRISNGRDLSGLSLRRRPGYILDNLLTLHWMVSVSAIPWQIYSSRTYISCAVGLASSKGKPIKAFEIVGSAFDPAAQVTKSVLTVKTLLSPLSREQIKIVRCLGLNYNDHAVRLFLLCQANILNPHPIRPK